MMATDHSPDPQAVLGFRFSVFRARRRSGVTLFELVMVLAVLVVLAAVLYPLFDGLYAEMRVSQAADQVRAGWAEARAHAMNEGRPYRFAILPGQGAHVKTSHRLTVEVEDAIAGGDRLALRRNLDDEQGLVVKAYDLDVERDRRSRTGRYQRGHLARIR